MGTISTDILSPVKSAVLSVFNLSYEFAHSDVDHQSPTDLGEAFAASVKYTVNFLTGSTLG